MKINQLVNETTTSGSIATTDTALGGVQSRGNPSIYGGKNKGTLFKGKKTSAAYANSISESAIREAELQEDDIILVPGQGRMKKSGFVPHGQSRVDHEVEMARSDLFSAAKNAQQVYTMIKDLSEDEGLDGWVQEKIIKANDYLNTVREYLEGKQVQEMMGGVIAGGMANESWTDVAEEKQRPDFAAKLNKNINKRNAAVVKTNKEIGFRVADIGAGGKEHNVKTDKAWDKQHEVDEGTLSDYRAYFANQDKDKPKAASFQTGAQFKNKQEYDNWVNTSNKISPRKMQDLSQTGHYLPKNTKLAPSKMTVEAEKRDMLNTKKK
jgi:hypothetical protein